MKKFEEKEVRILTSLNETELRNVKGGEDGPGFGVTISVTIADGWFDGSFFGRLFDGIRGNAEINEFD